MRQCVLLGFMFALVTVASAQPGVPALTGRVVDQAELLSPDIEAAITQRLAAHEDSTTNQVAVLTLPSLNGEVLEEFATTVFRTWALGQAEANNGVLLLIAHNDRKIRIEVGYGLEGELTDRLAGIIIREEMTPRFRAGDFESGTLAAVEAILGALDGTYEEPPARSFASIPESDEISTGAALGLGALFTLFPLVLALVGVVWKGPIFRTITFIITLPFLALGHKIFSHTPSPTNAYLPWLWVFGFLAIYIGLSLWMAMFPWGKQKRVEQLKKREKARRLREAFGRARKRGDSRIRFEGQTYTVPTYSSSSSGGSSFSSSSFSGGGGSSGGGGASGGW
ncbi:MAG: hypothetical protein Rubg2KO_19700 [Rubricoccaceae bacterium]